MGPKKVINKAKTVRRTVLMNPLAIHWPEIDENVEKEIIRELDRIVNEKPTETPTLSIEKTKKKVNMDGLIKGVNNVTKHVERDKLCSVILSPTGKAPHLNEHLVQICESKNIPIVAFKEKSQEMALIPKLFGLKSILALGILKSHEHESKYVNLVNIVKNAHSRKKIVEPKTSQDVRKIPPPPETSYPPQTPIKQEVPRDKLKEEEKMDFLSINSSLAFPEPDYPPELDSLVIKIIDPDIKLGLTNKRKHIYQPEVVPSTPKLLNDLNLKTTIHNPCGKNKRRVKKMLKRALKKNASN